MNTYRIWLKDGQSFCIKADKCAYNGNDIMFFNSEQPKEDIASFNLNNIAGWSHEKNVAIVEGE